MKVLEKLHIDQAKYKMGLRTAILLMIYAILNLIFQDFEHYVLLGLATVNISIYIIKYFWNKSQMNADHEVFDGLNSRELEVLVDNIHGGSFRISDEDAKRLILKDLIVKRSKIANKNRSMDFICIVNPEIVPALTTYKRKSDRIDKIIKDLRRNRY